MLLGAGGADDSIRIFVEGEGGSEAEGPALVCDVHQAAAHESDVNCVRWNRKHQHVLASAGDDHVVKVWRYRPSSDSAMA